MTVNTHVETTVEVDANKTVLDPAKGIAGRAAKTHAKVVANTHVEVAALTVIIINTFN